MKVLNEVNFKEAIIEIKILDDGSLLVVDSKTTVRYLDKETLKLLKGFKVNINHLRFKTKVIDFSSDGNYFGVLGSTCSETRLYNAKTKKAIAKVDRHQGEVSCVGIEPKNRYLFSCGDDGKTFAINIKTRKLAFTLPIHTDTVTDIVFSRDAQWIATASYDKKIQIFDMLTMSRKHRLIGHTGAVTKLHFFSNHRLFSIDKRSNAIVWDYNKGKVIKRLEGVHDDVLAVSISSDNKFVFLGTQLGYIIVYELETYTLLTKKYIKLSSSITALCFDEEKESLIVATQKGDIYFYHIYEGIDYLRELLKEQAYDVIQRYIDKNPLLEYTQIYQIITNLWEVTVKKAKISLERGDRDAAINLFIHFKNIPSKNTIMKNIMSEYEEFEKFKQLAKDEKLSLAYSLASKHPMYKDSKIYKNLEVIWKNRLNKAQKYAIDPKGSREARELLAPYRGIAIKTKLIQELFNQSEVYKRFCIAIGQKDFRVSFELIKQHPFLKELSDYDKLMQYGDSLYIQSRKYIDSDDTHLATKILRILVDFGDFSDDAQELIVEIENRQKFYNAIKEEKLGIAYNLLALDANLQETDNGKKLQKEWNEDVMKADEYALLGDVDALNRVVEKYKKISSKTKALGNIYGWCYMTQLEHAVEQKKEQQYIENGVKNYILYFGVQEQIESFFNIFKKSYPHTKLNLELQTKGSLDMWRPSMIVKSILE